jgi:hypothetical protein
MNNQRVNKEEFREWSRQRHFSKNAFERGRNDFKKGQLKNPYYHTSFNAKEWQRGFDKEYFLNLRKRNG